MKKISIILSSIALAAVVALYVITFAKCGKSPAASVAGGNSVAVAAGDIAFVNLDSLVRSYDMYFDLQKEFEAKAKSKEGDFLARRKKLEREMLDYQEKIEKGLVTRSQAQQLQENLQRKQEEIMQVGQGMQAELAEEEAVMLRKIQDNIQTFILEYNAGKNYRLILSNTGGNVLLYGDPTLNITSEVLSGLNATYVKARKK